MGSFGARGVGGKVLQRLWRDSDFVPVCPRTAVPEGIGEIVPLAKRRPAGQLSTSAEFASDARTVITIDAMPRLMGKTTGCGGSRVRMERSGSSVRVIVTRRRLKGVMQIDTLGA